MWAIVPVKSFCAAKRRLSPIASPPQRTSLARMMAERVLAELARTNSLEGVLVVSGESDLRPLVGKLGFEFLSDDDGDLNEALSRATQALQQVKVADVVIVHADLPLFRADEFDRIARLHCSGPTRKMTLVPDAAGKGTNLRFCRPISAVSPMFGELSAMRHAAAAKSRDLCVEIVQSASLSLDCDTPEDVVRIMRELDRSRHDPTLHTLFSGFEIADASFTGALS